MPVINNTPTKTLSACDAAQGALFTTTVLGCSLRIGNASPITGITNIEYEISLGATVVDTINTTSTFYDWDPAPLYYGETLSITQTITSSLGTFEYSADVSIPSSLSSCVFTFDSNTGAADTFDPTTTSSPSQSVYWRLPDDIVRTGASLSLTGSLADFDGTTKECRMKPNTLSTVTSLDFNADKIVGFVDFTSFTGVTDIDFSSNPALSDYSIVNLTNLQTFEIDSCLITGSKSFTTNTSLNTLFIYVNSGVSGLTFSPIPTWQDIRFYNCGVTGAFSFNNLTFNNATLWGSNNTGITSLTFSGASGSISSFIFENLTNLPSANIDLSWVSSFGTSAQIRVNGSTNVTGVNIGAATVSTCSRYWINNTAVSGTYAGASAFTPAANADYRFHQNAALTDITLNSSGAGTFGRFWCNNTSVGAINFYSNSISAAVDVLMGTCGMTAAEVNENLVNLDNAAAVSSGATGTIDIAGTNAAPDGSSGGFDGTTAKANLISYGYTVVTS